MAPIKLEDNIREKLEGREIAPSNDAWKKLSNRLDENSKKKNNFTIWYAIAACFIGVLIAVSVFSSGDNRLDENSSNFVDVNTSEKAPLNEGVPNLIESVSEENTKIISISEESNSITLNKKTNSSEEKLIPKKNNLVLESAEITVSETIAKTSQKNKIEKTTQLPEGIISNDELLIENRINELVAQVELSQQNVETVSAEEINTLLTNAEHKIRTEKTLDSKKIDPASLLGDVEFEMEKSFRDKVFSALGEGYNIIKTAVVDRNN